MSSGNDVPVQTLACWDRFQGRMVEERIQDEDIIRRLYGTRLGRLATALFFSRRIFSRLYGWWLCDRPKSRDAIPPFIKAFGVAVEDFEDRSYRSFNDFFCRRFKPGVRPFLTDPEVMPAFAEGACLAWERVLPTDFFPVKGRWFTAHALMGNAEESEPFRDGPGVMIRLRPHDYHRFHFLDAGEILRHDAVPGPLHTVNPLALIKKEDILSVNKRQITVQKTETFGLIAYIEIGAMTVGRIVQHFPVGYVATRGEEKGYFKCGGSTVIVLGEKGMWRPDPELVARAGERIETIVRLGSSIASRAMTEPGK